MTETLDIQKETSKESIDQSTGNQKIDNFNDFKSKLDTNISEIDKGTIQDKFSYKEKDDKIYLFFESTQVGFVENKSKIESLLNQMLQEDVNLVLQETHQETEELRREVQSNSTERIDLGKFSIKELLNMYEISKQDKGLENIRYILAEKLIEDNSKIELAKEKLGKEIVRNRILHNYFLDKEGFMDKFMSTFDYVQVNSNDNLTQSQIENGKIYGVYEHTLRNEYNFTQQEIKDLFINSGLSENKYDIGKDLRSYTKFSREFSELQEIDAVAARKVKNEGLINAIPEILQDKTQMDDLHTEGLKSLGVAGVAIGAVWGAVHSFSNYGPLKTIGAVLGLEFVSNMSTGKGAFELGSKLLFGGLDSMGGEQTNEIVDMGEESDEKKEYMGPVVFMSMILGEGNKLSDISGFDINDGKITFNVQKYKDSLPAGSNRLQVLNSMLQKYGSAEKINSMVLSGLSTIGVSAGNFSEKDDKKLSTLLSNWRERVKTDGLRGGGTQGDSGSGNGGYQQGGESESFAHPMPSGGADGNERGGETNLGNQGNGDGDGQDQGSRDQGQGDLSDSPEYSPEEMIKIGAYFGLEKGQLTELQESLDKAKLDKKSLIGVLDSYKTFIENELGGLNTQTKDKIKDIVKIKITKIDSVVENKIQEAKEEGIPIENYKWIINNNLKESLTYLNYRVLPSAHFLNEYNESSSKEEFIKKHFAVAPQSKDYKLYEKKVDDLLVEINQAFNSPVSEGGEFDEGFFSTQNLLDTNDNWFEDGFRSEHEEKIESELISALGYKDHIDNTSFLDKEAKEIEDEAMNWFMGAVALQIGIEFTGIGAIAGGVIDGYDTFSDREALVVMLQKSGVVDDRYMMEKHIRDNLLAAIGLIPWVTTATRGLRLSEGVSKLPPNKLDELVYRIDEIGRRIGLPDSGLRKVTDWFRGRYIGYNVDEFISKDLDSLYSLGKVGDNVGVGQYTVRKLDDGYELVDNTTGSHIVKYDSLEKMKRVLNNKVGYMKYYSSILETGSKSTQREELINSIRYMPEESRKINLESGKYIIKVENNNDVVKVVDSSGNEYHFDNFYSNLSKSDQKDFIRNIVSKTKKIDGVKARFHNKLIDDVSNGADSNTTIKIGENIDNMSDTAKKLDINGSTYKLKYEGGLIKVDLLDDSGNVYQTKNIKTLYDSLDESGKSKLVEKLSDGISIRRLENLMGLRRIPIEEINNNTYDFTIRYEVYRSDNVKMIDNKFGEIKEYNNIDDFIDSGYFRSNYKKIIGLNGIVDNGPYGNTTFKVLDDGSINISGQVNSNYSDLNDFLTRASSDEINKFNGAIYHSLGNKKPISISATIEHSPDGSVIVKTEDGTEVEKYSNTEEFYRSTYYKKAVESAEYADDIVDIPPYNAAEELFKSRIKSLKEGDGSQVNIGDYSISKIGKKDFRLKTTDGSEKSFESVEKVMENLKGQNNLDFRKLLFESTDEIIGNKLLKRAKKVGDFEVNGNTYRITREGGETLSDGGLKQVWKQSDSGGFEKVDFDRLDDVVKDKLMKKLVGNEALQKFNKLDNLNVRGFLDSSEENLLKRKFGDNFKKGLEKFNNRRDQTKSGSLARLIIGKSGQGMSWKGSIASTLVATGGIELYNLFQYGSIEEYLNNTDISPENTGEEVATFVAEILLFKKLHWVRAIMGSFIADSGLEGSLADNGPPSFSNT